ncbi:IAP-3 [Clanis bilineata nucleopolyhedrovirus]|uniref:IAP-3 n=1 Tax=Clanis bilineata nucleopolyhedrovirus TaxID=1307957 RepID=Q0N465_9ABAC|nr:IAP-3 [Clanis bilineata nucleopolyhedrovirus]ABF47378.1 IAP-3 [Clanis bilineata nucleopolyhedrovirus]
MDSCDDKYDSYLERLQSFGGWCSKIADSFAEAGFYSCPVFQSKNEHVIKCFNCTLVYEICCMDTLNPWYYHALYSPSCSHVIMCKGEKFSKNIGIESNK